HAERPVEGAAVALDGVDGDAEAAARLVCGFAGGERDQRHVFTVVQGALRAAALRGEDGEPVGEQGDVPVGEWEVEFVGCGGEVFAQPLDADHWSPETLSVVVLAVGPQTASP